VGAAVLSPAPGARRAAAGARLRAAQLRDSSGALRPPTGGVAASFAMPGDLTLVEPKALVGFAGPRVVQQTIGQDLPKGFQRAEFLLEHGMIDRIVPRLELREQLGTLLRLMLGAPPRPVPPEPMGEGAGEAGAPEAAAP